MVADSYIRPGKDDRQDFGRFISSLPSGSKIQIESLGEIATHRDRLFDALAEIRYSKIGLRIKRRGHGTITANAQFWKITEAIAAAHRSFKSEDTKFGLEQARANGRIGGRRKALSTDQILQAREMRSRGDSILKICTAIGCCRTTYYTHCHDRDRTADRLPEKL